MFASVRLRRRYLTGLILILVLACSTYACIATQKLGERWTGLGARSGSGEGAAGISGYTVAQVDYTLDALDPTQITTLKLDVRPTRGVGEPTMVQVKVDRGVWVNCSGGPATWTCAFSDPYPTVSVSPSTTLHVIAVQ